MTTKRADGIREVLCIVFMVIAWATYYIVSDWTVGYTDSAYVAGMLIRAAALVFLTAYLVIRGKFRLLWKQGKVTLILLLIGVLGFALDVFANVGFRHGSVGTGTVLLKTDILMANLATAVIFKQKLRATDWVATAVMLAGVVMVLDIDFSEFSFNWYDLFFLASALSVTVNAFVIKGAQEKYSADSDVIAYYNNFVVLLLFFVSAFISGDYKNLGQIDANWVFFLVIALGGAAQTTLYVFYYRNLRRYPVWRVKLYLLFVPVISCVAGALLFDESFTLLKGLGIALVLIGAAVIVARDKIGNAQKKVNAKPSPTESGKSTEELEETVGQDEPEQADGSTENHE